MARNETVAHVTDGDAFDTASGKYIRLANVTAPERWEPDHTDAMRALKSLIEGKVVSIVELGRMYGRVVADVHVDGQSVNDIMRAKVG